MNTTSLFAVIKVVNSTGTESALFFAESLETAGKLFVKSISENGKTSSTLKLAGFTVNKDRLDDFIVGEDDEEKLQFLTNALFSAETPYTVIREHI